jgi:hypothetical protein
MKLRLTLPHKSVTAKFVDSQTTRDFLSLLPLTLRMDDLFRREKIGHLPRALSSNSKPTRSYALGDIGYWPPGPDIAIFYHHDGEPVADPGIVIIGKIGAAAQALSRPGPVIMTLELVK